MFSRMRSMAPMEIRFHEETTNKVPCSNTANLRHFEKYPGTRVKKLIAGEVFTLGNGEGKSEYCN